MQKGIVTVTQDGKFYMVEAKLEEEMRRKRNGPVSLYDKMTDFSSFKKNQ